MNIYLLCLLNRGKINNAFPDQWDAFCSIISEIVGRKSK